MTDKSGRLALWKTGEIFRFNAIKTRLTSQQSQTLAAQNVMY